MPVQHRPCNNFIGSGTGLQNCRGRRLALHQCVRSVSSPANNSFQAIRTSMTSLYNKTVDDSCHKSHRIPKFLWTFQNQIITLWNWNQGKITSFCQRTSCSIGLQLHWCCLYWSHTESAAFHQTQVAFLSASKRRQKIILCRWNKRKIIWHRDGS